MVTKFKTSKRGAFARIQQDDVASAGIGERNFFDDLRKATVELRSSPKDRPVSTRLVTERVSRNLQLDTRS